MRIIKMSKIQFDTLEECVDFFESKLFGEKKGYFSIPKGHLSPKFFKRGEPLVFTYDRKVEYVAHAESDLTKNLDLDDVSSGYPVGFYICRDTLERVFETSAKDFERKLKEVIPGITLGRQGWKIVPDNDQTAAVLDDLQTRPVFANSERELTVTQRKYGRGGEGPDHLRLKEWVYAHPEAIGLQNVTRREMEHPYEWTGDVVDLLFVTEDKTNVVVEIETDRPFPGAHQLLKYRALRCGELGIPLDSKKICAVLVAWTVDERTTKFCKKYEIEYFERKL